MPSSSDVPAPQPNASYKPDEIILYGVSLEGGQTGIREAVIPFDNERFAVVQMRSPSPIGNPLEKGVVAMAVIYGFSYEGACYRYDRPRLLIFPYEGKAALAEGCGFAEPYQMWRIPEKKKILELNTRLDLAEMLVLDANLPGNRAPNTYGNKARLAHRSGKLSTTEF